jgi:hypothetical protein
MAIIQLSHDPAAWVRLVVTLIVLYIGWAVWTWYPLRHVPGPRLASFSYLWKVRNHLFRTCKPGFLSLKKYGSIVRVGPNYVVTDDPNVLRQISSARSTYTRDIWYTGSKVGPNDNIFTVRDNAEHDRLKSAAVSGYQGRENPDLEGAIDSQVVRLIDLIRRRWLSTSDSHRPLDFAPLSRFFTLDVITRLAYGEPFGHLDEGTDVYGWVEQVDTMMKIMGVTLDVPFIRSICFSRVVLGLFGPKPTDKWGIGKVMGYVRRTSPASA